MCETSTDYLSCSRHYASSAISLRAKAGRNLWLDAKDEDSCSKKSFCICLTQISPRFLGEKEDDEGTALELRGSPGGLPHLRIWHCHEPGPKGIPFLDSGALSTGPKWQGLCSQRPGERVSGQWVSITTWSQKSLHLVRSWTLSSLVPHTETVGGKRTFPEASHYWWRQIRGKMQNSKESA